MPTTAADPTTLAEFLRRRTAREASRKAITDGEISWSYAELQARIERLSATLAEGGLRAGDRVAFLGFNSAMEIVVLFATARLGGIFVPINFRLTPGELEFVIEDAGAHTLFVGAEHVAVVDSIRERLPCRRFFAIAEPTTGWESIEPRGPSIPEAAAVRPGDVALLMYTSGTTGRPKGAMLTHANVWANNIEWLLSAGLDATSVSLVCAPLFHVGGLCVGVTPFLLSGGHVVLHRQFEPGAFLRAVEEQEVTFSFVVPAMLLFASQHPDFSTRKLTSFRNLVVGGAPVPEALLRLYTERSVRIGQCYGMTESLAVTILENENAVARLGSCGRAGMLNEVELRDARGEPIREPHVRGEICMRGPNVTQGYWNRPEETAASFHPGGWLRSGDVGFFDEDRFLYICDRVKDMIISGGENVSPAEVESALYEHPAIAEVAVVGAPDDRWGERVVAVVALKPDCELTLDALQRFARERLAGYKIPREFRVVPALPRNSSGKVLKTEVRASLAAR
jgi:fatty-acyl-CoA synthase